MKINNKFKTSLFLFFLIAVLFTNCTTQNKSDNKKSNMITSNTVKTFTTDGAWCWFSNPRAIYTSENKIITGWVKKDGSIEVASLNLKSNDKKFNTIYPRLEFDDHDNPAFTILPDGNIFTMFAWHSTKKGVISNTTTNGSGARQISIKLHFSPIV